MVIDLPFNTASPPRRNPPRGWVICVLGPPGAGKTSSAAAVAKRLNAVHLSSGDIIRSRCHQADTVGVELAESVREGRAPPDAVVLELVIERLDQRFPTCAILDGFPRTLAQARALDAWVLEANASLRVIHIEVPFEVSVSRLRGRAAELDRWGDDDPAIIRQRRAVFERESRPVLAHYRARGLLSALDGVRRPEVLQATIGEFVLEIAP